MKATGIVRRIEACVIITQKCRNVSRLMGFRAVLQKNDEKQHVLTYT